MFRISKSDDPVESRDPEDETADQASPPAELGGSVASSALRWLRKSPKPAEPTKEPLALEADEAPARNIGFFRSSSIGRSSVVDEELELTTPLDDSDPHDAKLKRKDSTAAKLEGPSPSLAEAGHARTTGDPNDLHFEFDDDDDIDDFDDLSDVGMVPSSALPTKMPFFPDFDLNDVEPPQTLEASPAPSADLAKNAADQIERPKPVDEPIAEPIADADQTDGLPDGLDEADPEPLLEKPVLQKASKSPRTEEAADPLRLEDTPIAPLDTGLSLQPIPELQSEPASSIAASPKTKGSDGETVNLFAEGPESGDDDDLGASLTEPDTAEIDMLDLEGLEIDPLEMDMPDQADGQIAEDWHAQMADVLAGNNDRDGNDSLDEDERSAPEPRTAPRKSIEPSTSVLPLSKTLAQLAATSEPEAESPALVPTFPTRTARPKTAAGQPPSTLPTDLTDLSLSQLSLGIITNTPRLRRFAAVQVGDELVADQLVQSVIETALADPATLQHAADLGLTLITRLHQQRQKMLKSATAPELPSEAARAFETALCRGLSGADQFEIHQFAQAINRLDERDRGLLVLVALENLAYEQVAAVIQVPTEQVMSLISGARMHLRQALSVDDQSADAASSRISIPHAQEIEIHGYLDGELDGHHMADVDALVEYDEDAADRLLHYGIQGDLIRRLYAPLLNRPVPGKMLDALSAAARPARRSFGFGARKALNAGAILIVLGAAASLAPRPDSAVVADITATYSSAETQTMPTAPLWRQAFRKARGSEAGQHLMQ